jgi:hypothetical protein
MLISEPRALTWALQPAQLTILRSDGYAWARLVLHDETELDVDHGDDDDDDLYGLPDVNALDMVEEDLRNGTAKVEPAAGRPIGWIGAKPEPEDDAPVVTIRHYVPDPYHKAAQTLLNIVQRIDKRSATLDRQDRVPTIFDLQDEIDTIRHAAVTALREVAALS